MKVIYTLYLHGMIAYQRVNQKYLDCVFFSQRNTVINKVNKYKKKSDKQIADELDLH